MKNWNQYLLENLIINLWLLERLEQETQDILPHRDHYSNNHQTIATIHKLPSVKVWKSGLNSKRDQSASTNLPAKCQPNHANIQSAGTSSESLQSSFLWYKRHVPVRCKTVFVKLRSLLTYYQTRRKNKCL